ATTTRGRDTRTPIWRTPSRSRISNSRRWFSLRSPGRRRRATSESRAGEGRRCQTPEVLLAGEVSSLVRAPSALVGGNLRVRAQRPGSHDAPVFDARRDDLVRRLVSFDPAP